MVRTLRTPRRLTAVALAGSLTACGAGTTPSSGAAAGPGGVRVVAAEGFWGGIAAQLGGRKASVQSLVVDPDQDPHDYQPTPSDARALATALGLDLITPASFMKAVGEGGEVTAQDVATAQRQLAQLEGTRRALRQATGR